jgi:hypothetical protein
MTFNKMYKLAKEKGLRLSDMRNSRTKTKLIYMLTTPRGIEWFAKISDIKTFLDNYKG